MHGDQPGGPIHWRIHVAVPPDRVYAALDSAEDRAGFWAESAVEREGVIAFRFINGFECTCPILERRSPERWVIEYISGPARFDLTPDGRGGTDVLLTQTGVGPEKWNEVHAGWLNVLLPLKAWLEHGIDLRNHDPDRTWDQGYADQ